VFYCRKTGHGGFQDSRYGQKTVSERVKRERITIPLQKRERGWHPSTKEMRRGKESKKRGGC